MEGEPDGSAADDAQRLVGVGGREDVGGEGRADGMVVGGWGGGYDCWWDGGLTGVFGEFGIVQGALYHALNSCPMAALFGLQCINIKPSLDGSNTTLII